MLECVRKEKFVKDKVPYPWLSFFEVLQRETKACLQLDEVVRICADCGMQGTADQGVEVEEIKPGGGRG